MAYKYLKSLLFKLFTVKKPNINKHLREIEDLEIGVEDYEILIILFNLKIELLKDDIKTSKNKIELIKSKIEDKNYLYYLKTGTMLNE